MIEMDFRQIEAFVKVVRLRSFSKAGEALFLTQPTISAHVSSLENELGIRLLDRSNKDVLPTKAGKIFYDYAVNLLNTRDDAVHTLNRFTDQLEGRIEVVASSIPGQYLLPGVIRDFAQQYKNIRFFVFQADTKQVIREVREKRYELGLVGAAGEYEDMEYKFIKEDRLILITPNNKKYAGINTGTIAFSTLLDENFIIRELGSGTRQEFEKSLKNGGVNPKSVKVIAQMNSTEAIKKAVGLGLGVAVVSSLCIEDDLRLGRIKSFRLEGLEAKRALYVVYLKNRTMSPLLVKFKDYLLGYYQVD